MTGGAGVTGDVGLIGDVGLTGIVLVQPPTTAPGDDGGGQGEDFGKSSPVGFVVLLLFFIAVIFLVRSMNKHLRRVPETFDEPAADGVRPDAPRTEARTDARNEARTDARTEARNEAGSETRNDGATGQRAEDRPPEGRDIGPG